MASTLAGAACSGQRQHLLARRAHLQHEHDHINTCSRRVLTIDTSDAQASDIDTSDAQASVHAVTCLRCVLDQ
jgi:hypothetical protein